MIGGMLDPNETAEKVKKAHYKMHELRKVDNIYKTNKSPHSKRNLDI